MNFQGTEEGFLDQFKKEYLDVNFSWENLKEIAAATSLPIIIKGVMCAEDAKLAV